MIGRQVRLFMTRKAGTVIALLGVIWSLAAESSRVMAAVEDRGTFEATVKEVASKLKEVLDVGIPLLKSAKNVREAFRDQKKLEDFDQRLRELQIAAEDMPKLKERIKEARLALLEQREELFSLLNELRAEVSAEINRLEPQLDKLEKQIDLNKWWVTQLSLSRFPHARLMLSTGKEIEEEVEVPPNPKGIKCPLSSGGERTFLPGQVLSISIHAGVYKWVEHKKEFDFTPNTADPTATPRTVKKHAKGLEKDSREAIRSDLTEIRDAMTPGERRELEIYAQQRGRDWEQMAPDNQLDLVIQKVAQDYTRDIRKIISENETNGWTEVYALRYKIYELANDIRKKRNP
jgi:hypothetical protein